MSDFIIEYSANLDDQIDIAEGWKRILATVRSYADVEPTLSGRIEELIDWVTQEA